MTDPRLLADIQRAEGCRLTAYKDGLGNWTIGYGHLLDQSIDWTGQEWSQQTADAVLAADLDERASEAVSLGEWAELNTPCRQNAVIECIFNLGLDHWRREFPGTRASIQRQDWQSAHDNLLASPLWIKQVGLARVQRLANYLLTGQYP